MVKEIKINETEQGVLDTLEQFGVPMTLAELSTAMGKELKSGNINSLITRKGKMKVVGDRTITCECCGHKKKVKEYALIDYEPTESEEE